MFYTLMGTKGNVPMRRFITAEQADEILARNQQALLKEDPDGGMYFGLLEVRDGVPFDRLKFERPFQPRYETLFRSAVASIERKRSLPPR